MNVKFKEAVEKLISATQAFERGELKSVPMADIRSPAIADALVALAEECGCKLRTPLHIDSNGEYRLAAVIDEKSTFNHVYGTFGSFAAILNTVQIRTGIYTGAVMDERSSWCIMNHFEAEKLVRAQYALMVEKQEQALH